MYPLPKNLIGGLLIYLAATPSLAATELTGYIGLQSRIFVDESDTQTSIYAEPEFYWENEEATNSVTAKLFARYDDLDDERSHVDVRELFWLHVADSWELRVGVDKVYWGVAESNHLVDIINQTDLVDSVDGEQKLGQPMVMWSTVKDWGIIDAYILPYFRERTFPGVDGRLGSPIPVGNNTALYESTDEEKHIDWALRYSHTFGNWDIGVSHFDGTSREPIMLLEEDKLVPYYHQISHTGISAQATLDAWLLKFEGIYQETDNAIIKDSYHAFSTGFEYTFYSVFESNKDFGLLMELNQDSRNERASNPLQDDLFIGGRIAYNDVQDTQILFGGAIDLTYDDSYSFLIEASRRIGDRLKVIVDARAFAASETLDASYVFKSEDYVSASFEYYF